MCNCWADLSSIKPPLGEQWQYSKDGKHDVKLSKQQVIMLGWWGGGCYLDGNVDGSGEKGHGVLKVVVRHLRSQLL